MRQNITEVQITIKKSEVHEILNALQHGIKDSMFKPEEARKYAAAIQLDQLLRESFINGVRGLHFPS